VSPLRRGTDSLLGERDFRTAEKEAPAHTEVEPDGGGLVDDDNSEAICVFEYFFGVGVVRGPERVGPHPSKECEVLHHRGVVVTSTAYVEVLMLAESPKVERFVVYQELRAQYGDRANADGQHIAVHQPIAVENVDLQLVQVPSPRSPQFGSFNPQESAGAVGLRDDGSVDVMESHPDLR
jgi:hypothetical protein